MASYDGDTPRVIVVTLPRMSLGVPLGWCPVPLRVPRRLFWASSPESLKARLPPLCGYMA